MLDLQAAYSRLTPPTFRNPLIEVLQLRGFEPESEDLDHLRDLGTSITEAASEGHASTLDVTVGRPT